MQFELSDVAISFFVLFFFPSSDLATQWAESGTEHFSPSRIAAAAPWKSASFRAACFSAVLLLVPQSGFQMEASLVLIEPISQSSLVPLIIRKKSKFTETRLYSTLFTTFLQETWSFLIEVFCCLEYIFGGEVSNWEEVPQTAVRYLVLTSRRLFACCFQRQCRYLKSHCCVNSKDATFSKQ